MAESSVMNKIPVLLLISRAIDLSALHHSPRFQRYHFVSLAAMDHLENDRLRPKAQTLRNALNRKIERVGAQYLLAHLGLAFDRYPVEFLTTLLDVQELHPRLRIGLDKGLDYAMQSLRISAASAPEVNSLVARLARRGSVFNRDAETEFLAACLR
jgi:hypothetical protein